MIRRKFLEYSSKTLLSIGLGLRVSQAAEVGGESATQPARREGPDLSITTSCWSIREIFDESFSHLLRPTTAVRLHEYSVRAGTAHQLFNRLPSRYQVQSRLSRKVARLFRHIAASHHDMVLLHVRPGMRFLRIVANTIHSHEDQSQASTSGSDRETAAFLG